MKGIGKSIALLAIFSVCGSYASASKVFSIDSGRILQESREGRAVLSLNEKDKKELMDLEYKESQKVAKLRDEMEAGMRSGKIDPEKMQEKYEALNRQQRTSKHIVEDGREDYKMKEQKRVMSFRSKIHETASDFFKKQDCNAVFDRKTPGLLFLSESDDKTDAFLKELNLRHEKEKAKLALTKGNNKKA